jgi:hypothetical protein
MAEFPLALEELEVLVSPRSWLIDSLLEMPKLDRSEFVIELVLMQISFCRHRRTLQARERSPLILSADLESA